MSTLFFIACFLAIWEAFDFSLIPILVIVGVFFLWAFSGESEKTEEQIKADIEKKNKRYDAREKNAKKLNKPMIIVIIIVLLLNTPFWANEIVCLRDVKNEAKVYCEEAGLTDYSIGFSRIKDSDFFAEYTIVVRGEMPEDLDYEKIIHLSLELDKLNLSTWCDSVLFSDLYINGEKYTYDDCRSTLYKNVFDFVYRLDSPQKNNYYSNSYTYEDDTKDTSPQSNSTWYGSSYTPSGNRPSDDRYNTGNYSDEEDFYYDNYDDFESYEDAEDYFDDYYD